MDNRIYYFTGTGNCLVLARQIADGLERCGLSGMGGPDIDAPPPGCARIGFVFPVYYQGLPAAVEAAVERMDFTGNQNAYFFAVATYGATGGNALAQLERILRGKGVSLGYASGLRMFSNCVTLYNMSTKVAEITRRSRREAAPIARAIAAREHRNAPAYSGLVDRYYRMQIGKVARRGGGFHADHRCTACGVCAGVCPVGNIAMEPAGPVLGSCCQHCTACIQYCPTQAMNYRNKTQRRRRYHHPDIDSAAMTRARRGAST